MGAIRGCVAAPDSQPWKAHHKQGLLKSGLHGGMLVILQKVGAVFFASHTPILMDDFPPIATDATRTRKLESRCPLSLRRPARAAILAVRSLRVLLNRVYGCACCATVV